MTPLSLSCFFTASTRMFEACLHIFGSVEGGKWIYPAEGEAASATTSTPPTLGSRLRTRMGSLPGSSRRPGLRPLFRCRPGRPLLGRVAQLDERPLDAAEVGHRLAPRHDLRPRD